MAFTSEKKVFTHGKDSIAIRNYVGGILGGVALEVHCYDEEGSEIDEKQDLPKTLPVLTPVLIDARGNYVTYFNKESNGFVPTSFDDTAEPLVGFTVASVPWDEPIVGVITTGEINDIVLIEDVFKTKYFEKGSKQVSLDANDILMQLTTQMNATRRANITFGHD